MNHASISPDGRLLLAVGDELPPHNKSQAFFCKRIEHPDNDSLSNGEYQSYARYGWDIFAQPNLTQLDSEADPYFCTAFSPSGHICAVASQLGVLTFFDTSLVRRDMGKGDAVIAILKSSRPSFRHVWTGAIRSMCFSPAPWDLFAWAEDHGRVCVVDLRNALQTRQTIDLETESPDLENIDVVDQDITSEQRQFEIEHRFIQRQREALEAQSQLASVSQTADYLELAAERRRLERHDSTSRENLHSLSDSERQMIDSIGLRRFHGNLAAPISVNYNPNRRVSSPTWRGVPNSTTPQNPQSHSMGTTSIHDFMRHRNWERSRANDRSYQSTDRSYQPRRRSSIVISNPNADSNEQTASLSQSSSLAPIGTTGSNVLSRSPSRLPSGTSEIPVPHLPDPSDPWQTISDAIGPDNMSPDTIARLRSLQSRNHERRMQAIQGARERSRAEHPDTVEAFSVRVRETNARFARQMRASRADVVYDEIDRDVPSRRYEDPRRRAARSEDGVVTMGIGWDVDGRNL